MEGQIQLLLVRPAAVRDTKKTGHLNIQPPAHPTLFKPGHDNKAYLVGQQLLQSMPQSLAKSRTNPVEKKRSVRFPGRSVAGQIPAMIRHHQSPTGSRFRQLAMVFRRRYARGCPAQGCDPS